MSGPLLQISAFLLCHFEWAAEALSFIIELLLIHFWPKYKPYLSELNIIIIA